MLLLPCSIFARFSYPCHLYKVNGVRSVSSLKPVLFLVRSDYSAYVLFESHSSTRIHGRDEAPTPWITAFPRRSKLNDDGNSVDRLPRSDPHLRLKPCSSYLPDQLCNPSCRCRTARLRIHHLPTLLGSGSRSLLCLPIYPTYKSSRSSCFTMSTAICVRAAISALCRHVQLYLYPVLSSEIHLDSTCLNEPCAAL